MTVKYVGNSKLRIGLMHSSNKIRFFVVDQKDRRFQFSFAGRCATVFLFAQSHPAANCYLESHRNGSGSRPVLELFFRGTLRSHDDNMVDINLATGISVERVMHDIECAVRAYCGILTGGASDREAD